MPLQNCRFCKRPRYWKIINGSLYQPKVRQQTGGARCWWTQHIHFAAADTVQGQQNVFGETPDYYNAYKDMFILAAFLYDIPDVDIAESRCRA